MATIQEFNKRLLTQGGATFNLNTGQLDFNKGFGVSLEEHEQVFLKDEYSDEDLKKFLSKHIELLYDLDLELGGWIEGDKVYLDITEVVEDKNEAIEKGVNRNQLAIFDFENKEVIDLPPSQKTGTLTQQRAHKKLIIQKLTK